MWSIDAGREKKDTPVRAVIWHFGKKKKKNMKFLGHRKRIEKKNMRAYREGLLRVQYLRSYAYTIRALGHNGRPVAKVPGPRYNLTPGGYRYTLLFCRFVRHLTVLSWLVNVYRIDIQ